METTKKYLEFIVIFALLLLVAVLSQNKLMAIIATLGVAFNICFSIMDWRKQVTAPKFYNKQGQECTKAEMEAELTPIIKIAAEKPKPTISKSEVLPLPAAAKKQTKKIGWKLEKSLIRPIPSEEAFD